MESDRASTECAALTISSRAIVSFLTLEVETATETLVPEGNLEALIKKLTDLIDHPERWPEMGRAGRRAVEQDYNANLLNDSLVRKYQQLLAQRES